MDLKSYITKIQEKRPPELNPFTIEELVNRIEQSELNFKNGKFKSQKELEKISANW
ncbi:hypothetical protein LB456_00115 [Psychroflexus sp. CAK57W]|uniref:hypothetical protein n=1 Tax=Psychroflexus curvus TaxID=2873595 RepID=UPI001CCA0AB9|nr:hypothetical protein [Psychroflexus curvus]MBZ9785851.1 hypothetical protein [Psychroflexus curvus]